MKSFTNAIFAVLLAAILVVMTIAQQNPNDPNTNQNNGVDSQGKPIVWSKLVPNFDDTPPARTNPVPQNQESGTNTQQTHQLTKRQMAYGNQYGNSYGGSSCRNDRECRKFGEYCRKGRGEYRGDCRRRRN